MKYQNYSHYKLPITMNPLEYGDLIAQFDNNYIIQLTTTNILIIQQNEHDNFIQFFRKGELMFDFKDCRIDKTTFFRIINDSKFTFVNGKLIRSENIWDKRILNNQNSLVNGNLSSILKRGFSTSAINSVKHPGNIIKLRRIKSSHS
jgi:DNA mismatch repair ATPase MutL